MKHSIKSKNVVFVARYKFKMQTCLRSINIANEYLETFYAVKTYFF